MPATKTQKMVDYRCPACNVPMVGKQEVVHVSRIPKIDQCKHCKTKVVFDPKPCDLGCVSWDLAEGEADRLGYNEPLNLDIVLKPRTEAPVAQVAAKLLESVHPISTDGFAAARQVKEKFLATATPSQRLEYLDDPFFRMPLNEQMICERFAISRTGGDQSVVTPETVVQLHRDRMAAVKSGGNTTVKVEVKTEVTGAKVEQKVSGKKGFEIFGHSHTKITVWAGNQADWKVEDVQTMLKNLTGADISILSIRTFFYAGRAGVKPGNSITDEKTANGGRGPTVKLSEEQVGILYTAAGKALPTVPAKPKKKAK